MTRDITPWRKKKAEVAPEGNLEDSWTELHRRMDRLFDEFFEGFGAGLSWPALARREERFALSPSVDVSETDDEVRVTADLPGIDEKDLQVTLEDGLLTIRGEKQHESEEKKRNYHLVERSYGTFHRAIPLPAGIDPDQVKASFKKGVLTVSVRKTPESKARQRRIEITPE